MLLDRGPTSTIYTPYIEEPSASSVATCIHLIAAIIKPIYRVFVSKCSGVCCLGLGLGLALVLGPGLRLGLGAADCRCRCLDAISVAIA